VISTASRAYVVFSTGSSPGLYFSIQSNGTDVDTAHSIAMEGEAAIKAAENTQPDGQVEEVFSSTSKITLMLQAVILSFFLLQLQEPFLFVNILVALTGKRPPLSSHGRPKAGCSAK